MRKGCSCGWTIDSHTAMLVRRVCSGSTYFSCMLHAALLMRAVRGVVGGVGWGRVEVDACELSNRARGEVSPPMRESASLADASEMRMNPSPGACVSLV